MNKQPEVTAKTRERFMEAFWELYKDSPVEKIRIDALARKAGYNRTTFYEYFEDIYDLLHQAEDELIGAFKATMQSLLANSSGDIGHLDRTAVIKGLLALFDAYGDRIMALTGESGDTSFQFRLEEQAKPLMNAMLGADAGVYTGYLVSYVYNAIVGTIRQWYISGKSISEEDLISLLFSIMSQGAFQAAKNLSCR